MKSISWGLIFLTWMIVSCQNNIVQVELPKLKALIIDGENNHGVWPMTTAMIKDYLESSQLFDVDVTRKKYVWLGPHSDHRHDESWRQSLIDKYRIEGTTSSISVEEPKLDTTFHPSFSDYDVVISNLGWQTTSWPDKTKRSFEKYMKQGGGLVIIHAADNSFGDWPEYNKMIGLGDWGGRSQESGPYVYHNDSDQVVRDTTDGICGSHGPQQDFLITNRVDHPITRGLPKEWMHGADEIYDRLRGPAENMTVLATAYSDVEGNAPPWDESTPGSGRHEPVLMAIDYGEGRVFHTTLGHSYYSMESVGFIVSLLRGTEWASTGQVTQTVPDDFPDDQQVSRRIWKGNKG